MTKPTPEFNKGDRVEIPHRKTEGEVVDRFWNESAETWIYRIYRAGGDRSVKIYQEKHLEQ